MSDHRDEMIASTEAENVVLSSLAGRLSRERDEVKGEIKCLVEQSGLIEMGLKAEIATLRADLEDALSGIGVEAGRRRLHEDEIGRLRAAAAVKDGALRKITAATEPEDGWMKIAHVDIRAIARAALSTISSTQADSTSCGCAACAVKDEALRELLKPARDMVRAARAKMYSANDVATSIRRAEIALYAAIVERDTPAAKETT